MKIKYYYLFLIVAIVLKSSFCFSQNESRNSIIDSLILQQDYLKAIRRLEAIYDKDTLLHEIGFQLGELYHTVGDETNAKRVFNTLLSNQNFTNSCHQYLATIHENQGNIPVAIKHYLALAKAYPQNSVYLRKLGLLYLQGNEQSEGIHYYLRAINQNPRDMVAIEQLSGVFITLDSLSLALELIESGISIDSNNVGLKLLAAKCHYKLKNYSKAVKELDKVNQLSPLDGYFNKLLGYSYIQIDSLDRGIHHLRLSLQDKTSPEYAYFYLALAFERKKDFEVSLYYFDQAAEAAISQNIFHYYQGKARQLTSLHKYNAAMNEYATSQKYSEDPTVYYYMANLAEQQKSKTKEAIKYYTKYLSFKNGDPIKNDIATQRITQLNEKLFMKQK